MFQKRNFFKRTVDRLPFTQRHTSLSDRISDLPTPQKMGSKLIHRGKTSTHRLRDRLPSADVKWKEKQIKVPVVERHESLAEKISMKK
jgi:hypothetical protein